MSGSYDAWADGGEVDVTRGAVMVWMLLGGINVRWINRGDGQWEGGWGKGWLAFASQ